MEVFSARLKWLRIKIGYTQTRLAEEIGMSAPGYTKIENGTREPNLETLVKFPEILKESLDFLLGLTDHTKEIGEIYASYKGYLREMKFHDLRRKRSMTKLLELAEHDGIFSNYTEEEKIMVKHRADEMIVMADKEIDEITILMGNDAEKLKRLLPEVPLISAKTKDLLKSLN